MHLSDEESAKKTVNIALIHASLSGKDSSDRLFMVTGKNRCDDGNYFTKSTRTTAENGFKLVNS